jgi:DNA-binding SARP family transcriptional activator/pimeloyl-ACP methyl ester carboxylesterase
MGTGSSPVPNPALSRLAGCGSEEHAFGVSRLSVRVLGRFEVEVDGRLVPAEAWRHRRAAELVKLLALSSRRRLHRELVIDTLWPDLPLEAGAANLRKAAHHARRTVGIETAVVLSGDHVVLGSGDEVDVDAARFEHDAEGALEAGDPDACADVAGHYGGDLLPDDRYEDWVEQPRRRLRELQLRLLRRAGLWERVISEEPSDEAAARALMQLEAEAGNRSSALAHFHRLREVLRMLELEPSTETAELYRRIVGALLQRSPIRYVRSGGVNIAYQVVEGGPSDLLLIPGWVSHLALDWEEPFWLRWCELMTTFARLIRFDKRGTGLSDRPTGPQPLEERMADALAVLDAADVERADVLGWSEGGPLGILLAVRYPERVRSLTLYGTQASFRRAPDYPWGATDEERESSPQEVEREWGSIEVGRYFAPDGDEAFAERYAAYQRAGASPSAAAELNRMNLLIDIRHLLDEIHVPTLVISRRGDPVGPPDAAKYMADRIAGARFVELEGNDHVMWIGDVEPLCIEIERFVLSIEPQSARNVSGTLAS